MYYRLGVITEVYETKLPLRRGMIEFDAAIYYSASVHAYIFSTIVLGIWQHQQSPFRPQNSAVW